MTATADQRATDPAAGLTVNPLWPHQAAAFEAVRDRREQLIDGEMGEAGKSVITIALLENDLRVMRYGGNGGAPYRVLVLAPKSVLGVWPREIADHATSSWSVWNGDVVSRSTGKPIRNPSVARRAEALVEATKNAGLLRRPLMAVVGYEASWQGDMARLLVGTPWDALILDESHRLKSPSGKASRHAASIAARVRSRGGRVLALTGTPMPHSPLDLWGQLRALDGGDTLGTSYHRFCQRYGKGETIWAPGGIQRTVYKGVRDDVMDDFTRKVAPLVHRVPRTGFGLAEPVDVYRSTALDSATQKVYDELERDLISRVDAGAVTAANAMVLVLRLAQVASGYAPTIDVDGQRGEAVRLSDHKLPEKARLLADVLEDLPVREPVVVFCRFHHDLDAVQAVAEAQGRRYGELSGRRRDGLTADSLMSPDVDVLGAQIKSGGVGISLVRAHHAIYYTLGFELADYLQSRKRLHRPGQTRRVVITHLLAEDTVESAIYGALRSRKQVVDTVLSHLGGSPR